MEQIHDYDNACARYLLGELSELEQSQIEEAYFADDALFERFLAVKDDLIDAYARGDLAGQRRERFERHFLASQPRRQRVDEAKGFIRAVTAHSTETSSVSTDELTQRSDSRWQRFVSKTFTLRPLVFRGAVAALLIAVLAGSWVLFARFQSIRAERQKLQSEEAAHRQQEEERARAVVLPVNADIRPTIPSVTPSPDRAPQPKPANKQFPRPLPAQVASLFLLPFSPRDAIGSNSLLLSPGTQAVRLHLAFKGDDHRRYDVALRTLDGEQVLYRRALKASSSGSGKSVTLTLDPSIFRRQDYIITLSGLTADGKLEAIGDYYFRVERKAPQSTAPDRQ